MAADDREDISFADEMAKLGVAPLSEHAERDPGGKRANRDKRAAARPRQQKTSHKQKPVASSGRSTGGRATNVEEAAASETRKAAITTTELADLRARLRAAEDELRALQAERTAWREERAALEENMQEARKRQDARRQAERARLEIHARETRQRLAHVEAILAENRSLADTLRARGCADMDEAVTVLRELLSAYPDEFLDAVNLASAEPFARLLDQRVAFAGDGVDIGADDGCVVVRVPAERCEVTGGSDIKIGYRRFASECARAGVRRVTIVGGSPAYRRQLQGLNATADKLRLNLVSGTRRRTKRRADADMRNSDLVIIWGATELDHSVTSVYTSAPEKTLRVPHRGISRMLLHAADELGKRSK